ncbi:ABC transporter substrate binding protein [Desulfobacterales bacterium HSG16]|nr:ABC transporter substrate binding protein [Desulfobacterales bacterium HSG16]
MNCKLSFLIFSFTLLIMSSSAYCAAEKIHVLILHSYHENIPWSKGLTKGINSAFDTSGLDVEFHIEYMDHIRHSRNNIFPDLEMLYKNKFKAIKISIIIATDDIALDFLLKRRNLLFPKVPVVFCGPNNFQVSRISGHEKITGVAENPNFKGTLHLMFELHPEVSQIAVIADREPAALNRLKQLKRITPIFEKKAKFIYTTDENMEKLKEELQSFGKNTIVLYLSFLRDQQGKEYSVGVEVLKELSDSCRLPFYTYKKIDIGHGAVGGVVISEELMARYAAQMAVKILQGNPVSTIPIIMDTPTVAMFDYNKLKQFGINETAISRESIVVNKPFSFYKTYKRLVWSISGIIGFLIFFIAILSINIIRRKQAEEKLRQSEKKYRGIFDNATEGIFQTSRGGKIVEANDALARIMGFDSSRVLMQHVTNVKHQIYAEPEKRDELLMLIEKHGYVKGFETKFIRKDGIIIHVSINIHAILDTRNNILYYEGILDDITDKKQTQDLQISKQKAEASAQAKSDFLAQMSHEIRTPMNAIMGMTDLTLRTELTPRQYNYLTNVNMSAQSLLGIINDILDFSKIEAGKFTIESIVFYLHDVIGNILNMFSIRVDEKKLELLLSLDKNVPLSFIGDPLRLEQILINLVSNAIKFTDEGKILIKISITEKSETQATLCFAVQDSGVGISPEHLSEIFTPFTQADDSVTRKYGGTGLGLSICKKLVRAMGGDMRVESESGAGSTFEFSVILGLPSPDQCKSVLPSELDGLKVLVVDHNEASRTFIDHFLSSSGLSCEVTDNSQNALEKLAESIDNVPYELVIMDWDVPGIGEIETSKRIKIDFRLALLPTIVMVSASRQDDALQKVEDAEFSAFLIKPVNPSLLVDTIIEVSGDKDAGGSEEKEPIFPCIETSKSLKGIRVLLVEDNEINKYVATEMLEYEGIIVTTADNGREAVRKATQSDFDVILMDIQMPKMSGYEATHEILNHPDYNETPIIAMTAHALQNHREKCMDAGMKDYLRKPIDSKILFDTLVKWTSSSNLSSQEGFDANLHLKNEFSKDKESNPCQKLSVVDMKAGIKRLNGNRALYKKILKEFVQNHADAADKIENALKNRDMENARNLIHTIKGVSGNIAAKMLFNSALDLETAIEKDAANFESRFNQFQNSLNMTVKTINRHIEGYGKIELG